ncbi:PaaX family transcriptional regulator C-terminal domain-containing protein [Cryptosporangium phraense]|uniref:PaaX family transcriptional regulator n=1 Tax=Cryptosporangium phraense TaxID=2593070 RepID=A0A545AQL1_9ACTN|nr:PaaX family transcriptional regulator C-terminal domain-containing protein [Cryptosporangium phraense]TQS42995.1 PaaX family transcriptional regulator [Cryptosporangium phraense]
MTAPIVTRRQQLGAASAPSLLLTILGEFVLPSGRAVWTAALLDLMGEMEIAEKAIRQAIMRTADSGWIAGARIGRETRWSLTPAGIRLLREGTERIFGFATGTPEWDHRWLLTSVNAPENQRAVRAKLRTQLGWAGLGALNAVTWVTPWADREAEVRQVLDGLDLSRSSWSFVAAAGQIGDERSLTRAAWDLDEIENRYESFLDLVGRRRPRTDRQALLAQIRLVQEWRRFPLLDPGLPRELLPPRWSGHRAAEVFRERHAAWAPRARAAWTALTDRGGL